MLEKRTLPFREKLLNPLVLDYLSGKKELEKYYSFFPDKNGFSRAIAAMNYESLDRTLLVNELLAQAGLVENTTNESRENISLLENKNTFTITTGHQLCLFTGPLYFIYKIFSVINLCETLKGEFPEKNFVPVYWMASEDHDFEEVNHLFAYSKKVEWQSAQTGSVGRFATAELEPLADTLAEILGKSDNAAYLVSLFKKAYLGHRNLSDATRYLVNELFGRYGIVILDGQSAALKKKFKAVFKEDIFNQLPYKKITEQIAGLQEMKYGIQVNPREINCFYADGPLRARFEKEGDKFKLVGASQTFSSQEIEQMLDNDPEKISPNVALRPAYQQVILPNLAYVGGPGELAYWLEYKSMFEALKLNYPVLVPRKFVYLVDAAADQKMEKLDVTLDDLSEDEQSLVKRYLEKSNKAVSLDGYKKEIDDLFAKIGEEASAVDKTLSGATEAEKQKALNAVSAIEGKMNKAVKLKSETELNQLKNLRAKLFPSDVPQERYDNFSMYYVKWSGSFFSGLKSALTYDLSNTDIIILSEQKST